MLQAIHDKSKGWISYAIVGFVSIPFGLWGINSYMDGGQTRAVAVVNGEDVPARDVQAQLLQIRQQLGQMAASLGDDNLKKMALDNVVNQVLLRQKVQSEGYRASAKEVGNTIADIEAFQKDGQFDKQQYQAALQMSRRSEGEFERQVREDLTQGQFRQGVSSTAFIPKAQAEFYQSLRNQKRDVEVFSLKTVDFDAQVQITDTQIAAYYEENKSKFMTDEKVKLSYLELAQDALAKDVQITEGGLKTYFDENAERYITPGARNASHILAAINETTKEEDAKKRIDALSAELKAGTKTFEAAARAESDDKVAAGKDGIVGDIVAGDWDPEFEKAVFAQEVNQLSEPIKTGLGYEIIRVNSVKEPVQKAFADVKSQVEGDYRRTQAEKLYLDKAELVQTTAYEQSGDLAPAAKAAGLQTKETDWITRVAGEGIAANPKVREIAFSDDVQKGGKNSEVIQLSDAQSVVVRVIDQQASVQKPLADVREDILTVLKAQESRKLVATKGAELLKQTATTGWAALDASGLGKAEAVEKPGKIERVGSKLLPNVIDKAFSMARPAEGKQTWDSVVLPSGDFVLMTLKSVENGPTTVDQKDYELYGNAVGTRELGALLQSLHTRAEIELHPENI